MNTQNYIQNTNTKSIKINKKYIQGKVLTKFQTHSCIKRLHAYQ